MSLLLCVMFWLKLIMTKLDKYSMNLPQKTLTLQILNLKLVLKSFVVFPLRRIYSQKNNKRHSWATLTFKRLHFQCRNKKRTLRHIGFRSWYKEDLKTKSGIRFLISLRKELIRWEKLMWLVRMEKINSLIEVSLV